MLDAKTTFRCEADRVQCSTDMSVDHWKGLMLGSRSLTSYEKLTQFVKEECPQLYDALALDYPNPYASGCGETDTHYILAHSMKQYFILK